MIDFVHKNSADYAAVNIVRWGTLVYHDASAELLGDVWYDHRNLFALFRYVAFDNTDDL